MVDKNKFDELREKSAKKFDVSAGNHIEDVCKEMSQLASIYSQTYKATFNGKTFYVKPDDTPQKALRSYAEKVIANADRQELLYELEWNNKNAIYDDAYTGMLSSVVTEKIIKDHPEDIDKISPITLLNAYHHNDGSFGDGENAAKIKPLLDAKIETYMQNEILEPNIHTFRRLGSLGAYIKTFLDGDKPKYDKRTISNRLIATRDYIMNAQTDKIAKGGILYPSDDIVDLYKLAQAYEYPKLQETIAQHVSPIDIYDRKVSEAETNPMRAHILQDMFLQSTEAFMNGTDNILPRKPQDVYKTSRLFKIFDDIYPEATLIQRQEKFNRDYLDYLQKNPEEFSKLELSGYRLVKNLVAELEEDPKSAKYSGLAQKARDEIVRLSTLQDSKGKGSK